MYIEWYDMWMQWLHRQLTHMITGHLNNWMRHNLLCMDFNRFRSLKEKQRKYLKIHQSIKLVSHNQCCVFGSMMAIVFIKVHSKYRWCDNYAADSILIRIASIFNQHFLLHYLPNNIFPTFNSFFYWSILCKAYPLHCFKINLLVWFVRWLSMPTVN